MDIPDTYIGCQRTCAHLARCKEIVETPGNLDDLARTCGYPGHQGTCAHLDYLARTCGYPGHQGTCAHLDHLARTCGYPGYLGHQGTCAHLDHLARCKELVDTWDT